MKDFLKKLSRRIFPFLGTLDKIEEAELLKLYADQLYSAAMIILAFLEEIENAQIGTD